MASQEFIRYLRSKYGAPGDRGPDCGAPVRAGGDRTRGELFERLLADATIPLAVFHSRRLRRDFVLARDAQALDALTEPDRRLPVLTFADCEKLAGLSARDLAPILDVRAEFGPAAELVAVRPRLG